MSSQIELLDLPISEVRLNPKNPRIIRDKRFMQLKQSIKDFPEMLRLRPCVIDESNIIIGGNMRYKAMKELGHKTVPCIRADQLSEEQKKEFIVKDNLSYGEWDFTALLEGWNQDLLLNWGVEFEQNGRKVKEDDFNAEEYYDSIVTPITVPGDLYEFKEEGATMVHRLLCGDSRQRVYFEKLFEGKKARLIFTDPPYNVDYKSQRGNSYNSSKYGGTGNKIFNDNKTDQDCLQFYVDTLRNMFNFSTDDCCLYWWFASKNVETNRAAWSNTGWQFSQQIIWLKNSMTFALGQDYHRLYEPCLFGWKTKQKHFTNKKYRNLKDCFSLDIEEFKTIIDVWYEKRDQTNMYVHPTQKPLRLAERALKKNSEEGDIVADGFGGSGSTLLTAHQMLRIAYLMELDPKFCDAIVRRFSKMMNDGGKHYAITKNGIAIDPTTYEIKAKEKGIKKKAEASKA